jgi:asparagine synthase (glutamine-hydrolysing)
VKGVCGIVNFDAGPVDGGILRRLAGPEIGDGLAGARCRFRPGAGFAQLVNHRMPVSGQDLLPLVDEERNLMLVADVRIDNREDLLESLLPERSPGEPAPTDAHLLLAAYLRWGVEFPRHVIGDFALALWDGGRKRLLLARDALGIRTLYHSRQGGVFVFATQSALLLRHPLVSRELDESSLARYLTTDIEESDRSYYREVRALPPGHLMTVNAGTTECRRHWDIDPGRRITHGSIEEYGEQFRDLFGRAVRDRLRTAEGKIGVLASGGLDSSAVAAVARRELSSSPSRRLLAGSFVFSRLAECDESEYQDALLDGLDADRLTFRTEELPLIEEKGAFPPDEESPLLWLTSPFRRAFSSFSSHGAGVVLTGAGGDEVHQGTGLVYAERLSRGDLRVFLEILRNERTHKLAFHQLFYRCIIRPLTPDPLFYGLRVLRRRRIHPHLPDWIDRDFARRTGLTGWRGTGRAEKRFAGLARQEIYSNLCRFGSPSIKWGDRLAARHGIELLHPFWDRRIVEFALALPPEIHRRGGQKKQVLREAMQGILTDKVRLRPSWPKPNFDSYVDENLRRNCADLITALLEDPLLGRLGMVDAEALRRDYRAVLRGKSGLQLLAPISLELWLRNRGGSG